MYCYYKIFSHVLSAMVQNTRILSSVDKGVMEFLIQYMSGYCETTEKPYVDTTLSYMAKEMHVQVSSVSRAVNRLCEWNVLKLTQPEHNENRRELRTRFMFNPNFDEWFTTDPKGIAPKPIEYSPNEIKRKPYGLYQNVWLSDAELAVYVCWVDYLQKQVVGNDEARDTYFTAASRIQYLSNYSYETGYDLKLKSFKALKEFLFEDYHDIYDAIENDDYVDEEWYKDGDGGLQIETEILQDELHGFADKHHLHYEAQCEEDGSTTLSIDAKGIKWR